MVMGAGFRSQTWSDNPVYHVDWLADSQVFVLARPIKCVVQDYCNLCFWAEMRGGQKTGQRE